MAGIRSFKATNFSDKETSKLQDNIDVYLNQLTNIPLLDGVLLRDVVLSTGSVTKVDHKLGRKLIGWMITRQRASSIIWDTQDTNNNKNTTLDLNCSADVTIDIWVF